LLAIVVGADGRAHNIRVVKSRGLGLDENAVATVGNWRFQPGALGDQPVR
jgi:TonB family protein